MYGHVCFFSSISVFGSISSQIDFFHESSAVPHNLCYYFKLKLEEEKGPFVEVYRSIWN